MRRRCSISIQIQRCVSCKWVAKDTAKRCNIKWQDRLIRESCAVSCGLCEETTGDEEDVVTTGPIGLPNSGVPSADPSTVLSKSRSLSPSAVPSAMPSSVEPSTYPSTAPSAVPSGSPSALPSVLLLVSTASPTANPTVPLTTTRSPTVSPTSLK